MTPSWIEPATYRFVAQRLKHCVTAVPICASSSIKYRIKEIPFTPWGEAEITHSILFLHGSTGLRGSSAVIRVREKRRCPLSSLERRKSMHRPTGRQLGINYTRVQLLPTFHISFILRFGITPVTTRQSRVSQHCFAGKMLPSAQCCVAQGRHSKWPNIFWDLYWAKPRTKAEAILKTYALFINGVAHYKYIL